MPNSLADVTDIVFGLLCMGLALSFVRLIIGPSLPDRVVALELTSLLSAGIIVNYAVASDQDAFLDAAIVLALIAFLATVTFARYLEKSLK